MADVFVSYDRRDRELAEKVVSTLTDQGLTVWWDDRITPHETWDKTIEREVDSARRVLVLWTNNSVQSDWVRTEAGAAKESTPPKLIQARFSDCKVPLAFRLLQHVDLIGWSPRKKHAGWDRLVHWLKADNEAAAPVATAPVTPVQVVPKPAPVAPPVVAAAAPTPVSTPPSTDAEPAAPQAPMGFANLAATDAVAAETPATSAEAVTGSAPAAGMGGSGFDSSPQGAAAPTSGGGNKKVLIIAGAVIGGLLLIAVLMAVFGGGGGGGDAADDGSGGEAVEVVADDETQQVLGGYLDGYQERFAAGASAVGDDEVVSLAGGETHDYAFDLDAGETYAILGACDTNCTDVDLFLTDPAGGQVAQDVLLDDYPVIVVTPEQSGEYGVSIGMVSCGVEACGAAARVTRGS